MRTIPFAFFLFTFSFFSGCGEDKTKPLQATPDEYQRMVSAFYTGVTALQAGSTDIANTRLKEATQIVPREPASWFNLALLAMQRSDQNSAATALQKAQETAPPNSQIEMLAGLLAGRQGRSEEALAHLRKAVELDPANLRARSALIQAISRQSGADSQAEVERQWEQILAVQPDNLRAMLELTRLAAASNNAAQLRQRIDQLKAVSGSWPSDARQKLAELEKAAGGSDPRTVITRIAVLGNLLKPTPAYQQSYAALESATGAVAEPMEQFLRLPQPSATPADPDESLSFTSEPLGAARVAWARALPLLPAAPSTQDQSPPNDGPATIVQVAGSTLTLTAPASTLPFPGAAAAPEGVLPIDWNNDYRPDLALAGPGGLRLLQQTAPSRWTDVTARAGLPSAITGRAAVGAWAIDIDLEGDLDILLGSASGPPLVLRNNGDGTWSVLQPFAGVSGVRAFAWVDLDGDGDGDVALIDGQGALVVFDNERSGHYRRFSPVGAPLVGAQGGHEARPYKIQALSVADPDRDGRLDLVVLTTAGTIQRVSRRTAGDGWDVADLAQWPAPSPANSSPRLLWADLDNNGALDLVTSGSGGSQVWLADARGILKPLAAKLSARALSTADLNQDGRLDLVGVSPEGTPVRLINRGVKTYQWQIIRTRGEEAVKDSSGNSKINSFGIGGEAELRAGLLTQKQPITGPSLHFGVGDHDTADYVRLLWPNGQLQGEFNLKAGQRLLAKQRLTSSCPWLFAHDGRSMRFVTDILWKSPLGLRINAQDTAGTSHTLDWVKVRGDQLQARNGFYDLSITAELWETNFFDHVALMTVDHPAGTEVFIDERFSIPQPPLAIHTTGPLQPVTRAWDDRGRDVTDLVRARDGRYLDTFGFGQYQGVTRDHYVEVELPVDFGSEVSAQSKIQNPKSKIVLVAHGWVFPTDSSINVALSQGSHAPPTGLSLEVQDRTGKWVTARAGLGFPAGKTKNVLIDLTEALRIASRNSSGNPKSKIQNPKSRVRLRTNLEIYWDSLAVATLQPEAPLKKQLILPRTAELRYRGFSTTQASRTAPELPDYNRLDSTTQKWLDLIGFYTRFGDVRELLTKVDDRYTIMNAGDEIPLRFPAPPPPRAGWTRDFVFISDGWDKDGNFNTSYSKTVLPLPSHDQSEYNRPPGRLEDDPVYRRHARDWETYHTRYVTPAPIRRALWPERQWSVASD